MRSGLWGSQLMADHSVFFYPHMLLLPWQCVWDNYHTEIWLRFQSDAFPEDPASLILQSNLMLLFFIHISISFVDGHCYTSHLTSQITWIKNLQCGCITPEDLLALSLKPIPAAVGWEVAYTPPDKPPTVSLYCGRKPEYSPTQTTCKLSTGRTCWPLHHRAWGWEEFDCEVDCHM